MAFSSNPTADEIFRAHDFQEPLVVVGGEPAAAENSALVRHAGNLYELNDPTFGNKTWAAREALEAETSGYFLVPAGPLPAGWRPVDQKEGAAEWGKGVIP